LQWSRFIQDGILARMPDIHAIQDLEALDSIEELQEICRKYLTNGGEKH